jgi:hypothetical protein
MAFADRLSCDRASVQLHLRQDLASNALRDLRNRSRDSDTAAALHLFQCWLSAHMYSAENINPASVPAHLAVACPTTTMTILLANTWAPGTGALEPSVVPRYLCALVSALLDAGARVRFILRRTEDASALQVAFGNAAWEASVVPAADDVPAIERAVNGASVVLWADGTRGRQLVRDGRVLLQLAASMGVQRFVYRSQVQIDASSKASDEAIALYSYSS